MKLRYLFIIATIAFITTLATASAFQVYDPYTRGYQQVSAWSHNTPTALNTQPRMYAPPLQTTNRQYRQTNAYLRGHQVNNQRAYYGEVGRPQGYGLITQRTPYPTRANQYCENNNLLGHTSAWRPGRFYSGMNGLERTAPSQRTQTNRCAPSSRLNLNTFTWNY